MNQKAAEALGVCKALTGKAVLITTMPWPTVDPLVIGVPMAFLLTIVVSLLTKPPSNELLDKCFKDVG